MRSTAVRVYVTLIAGAAALSLTAVSWNGLLSLSLAEWAGLALLMAFGLLSERLSVGMTFIPRGASHTITFIPLLSTVLLFGSAAPVVFMAVTGGVAEVFIRRKERIRAVFNVSQYVLSTSLAGAAFLAAGGTPLVHLGAFELQLVPFATFLFVLLGINHGTVSLAIALSQSLPFREVLNKFVGPSGVNAFYDVLVSPLAIVVAFFYYQAGAIGLVLSMLPLIFIRYAYLNNYRLEQANRDLLKALVKAIETRDPYTSGHSQRVRELAGRIAKELAVGNRRAEAIEMAALLHDVGKIDVVYSEILRKPERLSPEELAVMQSHVTKGVEFLKSLASVPDEVIRAVRHHHEREDGGGYPDALRGEEIPLGAKVISLCDAIDAMLSDRPYRSALTLGEVRYQLSAGAGTQFDEKLVEVAVRTDLLEEHVGRVSETQKQRAPARRKPVAIGAVSTAAASG